MNAIRDPVQTAGTIGGVAGKAVASVTNAASNASRAARTVTEAVSHPGQTAQKAARAATGAEAAPWRIQPRLSEILSTRLNRASLTVTTSPDLITRKKRKAYEG